MQSPALVAALSGSASNASKLRSPLTSARHSRLASDASSACSFSSAIDGEETECEAEGDVNEQQEDTGVTSRSDVEAEQQPEAGGVVEQEEPQKEKDVESEPSTDKRPEQTEKGEDHADTTARDLHVEEAADVTESSQRELKAASDDSLTQETKETKQQLPARPSTARSANSTATVRRPFVPLTTKSWRLRAMQSNTQITRLVKAALLQTLLHAIRCGSVEGVKVAIERGVQVQYLDSRQRNLIMYASYSLDRYVRDVESSYARLQIVIILSDAGCDINHADQLGWSCLHYACACGADDVATELIRRGARVEFNPYGYGPEDFLIPKVVRAKSLLQHTEQLQHEQNVCASWTFFRRQAEKAGYGVKCSSNCDLGKPLKVTFQAPTGHSPLDRIRVVDMNSDVALWLQVSKTFSIPPGDVGTITLDAETLDRPSLYRIFYEKYEPTPIQLPASVTEQNLCVKNLDTGTTVSMGSVNDLVLKELKSTRSSKKTKQLSSSSRPAPESDKPTGMTRRMSTTYVCCHQLPRLVDSSWTDVNLVAVGRSRCREIAECQRGATEEEEEDEQEAEFSGDETITTTEIAEHPAVTSITGVYKIVAMGIVSVSTLKSAKANEYEIVSHIVLLLLVNSQEPKVDGPKRSARLIVRRSQGQSAAVNPGDCLVAIGNANIEHAGLKHTLWELNEAKRPLVLRFRRGNAKEKKSLFKAGLSKLKGPRRQAAIAV
ncbi:hypothetical protein BBJ28_00018639 [Nothophytophthora sp. Chile5]|nr:hypothetical protein BBJ28_00018639 [Nothophytophthora sp. Chile5]